MRVKPILLKTSLIISGLALAFFVVVLMQPSITVQVDSNSHRPLQDKVTIDGINVAPKGAGGTIYTKKVWFGKKKIVLTGPFIQTQVVELSPSPFENTTTSFTSVEKTAQEILAEVFGGSSLEVTGLKVFKDFQSIVAYVAVDGVVNDNSFPSLLVFDESERIWQDVSEQYVADRSSYAISEPVKEYFSELTND